MKMRIFWWGVAMLLLAASLAGLLACNPDLSLSSQGTNTTNESLVYSGSPSSDQMPPSISSSHTTTQSSGTSVPVDTAGSTASSAAASGTVTAPDSTLSTAGSTAAVIPDTSPSTAPSGIPTVDTTASAVIPTESSQPLSETTQAPTTAATQPYVPQGNLQMLGLQTLLVQDNGLALAEAYDAIAAAAAVQQERVPLENIPCAQVAMLFTCVKLDHPQYFWLSWYSYSYSGSYAIAINLQYTHTGQALTQAQAQLEAVAAPWLARLTADMSEYEKALLLNDLLAEHVLYGSTGDYTTAYGVLTGGVAVCQGYAEAYHYLLNRAGILSTIVTGTVASGSHAWNLVRMDGNWYHVDVTWNDPNEYEGSFRSHAYFGLTDAMMAYDHQVTDTLLLPGCNSLAANYYSNQGRLVDSFDRAQFVQWLKASKGEDDIYIYIAGDAEAYITEMKACMWEMQAEAGMSLRSYTCWTLGKEIIITFS